MVLGLCSGTALGLGLSVWGFFLNPVGCLDPAVDLFLVFLMSGGITLFGLIGGVVLGTFAGILVEGTTTLLSMLTGRQAIPQNYNAHFACSQTDPTGHPEKVTGKNQMTQENTK
jgi:hypothetical protein